jgi:hypothetical protein
MKKLILLAIGGWLWKRVSGRMYRSKGRAVRM